MTLAAGKRKHRIRIERHDGTLVNGEPTYNVVADWDTLFDGLPAAYQDVTGGEMIRGRQMEAHTVGLFQVLSTPRTRQIRPKMRVVMGQRTLNIVSVLDLAGDQEDLAIQVAEIPID